MTALAFAAAAFNSLYIGVVLVNIVISDRISNTGSRGRDFCGIALAAWFLLVGGTAMAEWSLQ